MQSSMVKAPCGPRPFSSAVVAPSRKGCIAAATRRVAGESRVMRQQLRTRSAEADPAVQALEAEAQQDWNERGRRRQDQDTPQFKQFLPLPKPAHLIYIKPTVAVVAGVASRSSVGLKMTAGDNQLERYVIEFYSKSVK